MAIRIIWNPRLSVGEKTLDMQHKRMLTQVNKLHDVIEKKQWDKIDETIVFMEKYIDQHLEYEEKYMRKIKFPGYAAHKAVHDSFRKAYPSFKKELMKRDDTSKLAEKVNSFLGEWWMNHIAGADMEYCRFAKSKKA